jgi:hypothetical protein
MTSSAKAGADIAALNPAARIKAFKKRIGASFPKL